MGCLSCALYSPPLKEPIPGGLFPRPGDLSSERRFWRSAWQRSTLPGAQGQSRRLAALLPAKIANPLLSLVGNLFESLAFLRGHGNDFPSFAPVRERLGCGGVAFLVGLAAMGYPADWPLAYFTLGLRQSRNDSSLGPRGNRRLSGRGRHCFLSFRIDCGAGLELRDYRPCGDDPPGHDHRTRNFKFQRDFRMEALENTSGPRGPSEFGRLGRKESESNRMMDRGRKKKTATRTSPPTGERLSDFRPDFLPG